MPNETFIHSILAPNQAVAADGDLSFDLPVNPLSMIYVHLSPLNETSTITTYRTLAAIMSALDRVNVSFRGVNVIDIVGNDLLAFLVLAAGLDVRQSNLVRTDNDRRSLVLPIPLARNPWSATECFPATKRGELRLTLTLDIADTGFDGLRISVETLELPDANPQVFQRLTQLVQTFAATGINDIELPIGNVIRGILAFGTTGFAGATPAPTLGQMRVLYDNIERGYASTDFEVSKIINTAHKKRLSTYLDHFHEYNGAAAGEASSLGQEQNANPIENHTYIDYDPTDDDRYSLDTRGASRVNLRVDAETANLARFVVNERVNAEEFLRRP